MVCECVGGGGVGCRERDVEGDSRRVTADSRGVMNDVECDE